MNETEWKLFGNCKRILFFFGGGGVARRGSLWTTPWGSAWKVVGEKSSISMWATLVTRINVEKFGSAVAYLTKYLNNMYVFKCV